jgi:integrase
VGSGGLVVASIGKKRETRQGPRWDVIWYNPGDPKQKSYTCTTHEIAKRVRLDAEAAIQLGRPYFGPRKEAAMESERRAAALVDLRVLLVEYIASRRRAGRAESSIYQIDTAISLFLATLSDDDKAPIPGERLTVEALNGYYDHLRTERGCSLRTSRDRVQYIERWWAWATNQGRWPTLPHPRRIEMAEPPVPPEPTAPTWVEMDRVIACATGWHRDLFTVCRFTGLRANDQAMQLRRADIDPDAATLRIRPELGKTRAEKRGRVVPVSRHLLAAVAAFPVDPDGWLIHVPPNAGRWTGPPKRVVWNLQAERAWERAGVRREVWDTQPSEDGHRHNGSPLHAFRDGVITGLQVLGVPLPDIQYLVGHKIAGGVTVERYTDPTAVRKLREAVDLIPAPGLVEVRRIQGGGVVWAGLPAEGRWRRE